MKPWLLSAFLLIGVGAASAKPLPLSLIWNISPSPHLQYARCGDQKAKDFCLPAGRWVGVCVSSVDGRRLRSLKAGAISLNAKGEVNFTGCPEYEVLIASSVARRTGISAEKAVFRTAGCQTSH